jgi:type II secretory pathway component PulF
MSAWLRALLILVVVNFALVGFLLYRVVHMAQDGQQARITQCTREPVMRKIVAGAAHYRIIQPEDARTFMATAPKDCPAP